MSDIALYRKYRPKCFSDIIGQKSIITTLKNSLTNNNFYHSYIFSGTRGSGKTSVSRILAKVINCLDPQDNDCCNKCKNCLICNDVNNVFDIYEIDAASNSGVDEIRKIIDVIYYLPVQLNKKIYIIDEAHMLSNAAWNALLKTIEEPPSHVMFIFATTEINKIPMTIISRCQRFDFKSLNNDELVELIDNVCANEEILISNNAKNKIALLANGSARDCLSILHQVANYASNEITVEIVNELFGLVSLENKINFINKIYKQDLRNLLTELPNLTNNYLVLTYDLINILIDKIVYIKTNDSNLLKHLSISDLYKIEINEIQCNELIDIFMSIYEKIRLFDNGLLYFETILLSRFNFVSSHDEVTCETKEKNDDSEIEVQENIDHEIKAQTIQSYDDCFTTKTITHQYIKINNDSSSKIQSNDSITSNTKKTIVNEFSIDDLDKQLIFNQIASNYNNKNKELLNEKLDLIKLEHLDEYQFINASNKFLITSEYGAILIFDFENDVQSFNTWYYPPNNGYQITNKIFDKEFFILACTKNQVRTWTDKFKESNSKYNDINYVELLKLDNKNKIEKILEIWNN